MMKKTDKKVLIGKIFILILILYLYHPGILLNVVFGMVILGVIAYFILVYMDRLKEKKCLKKELTCTKEIYAVITKIKRNPDVEFDNVKVTCQMENGEFIWKSDWMKESKRLAVGDRIIVYVEPENYNNFYIVI